MRKKITLAVRVTRGDVRSWLRTVARIDPDSPRAAYYVKHWNVRDKIMREKLAALRSTDIGVCHRER